jgi:hypothetical protein
LYITSELIATRKVRREKMIAHEWYTPIEQMFDRLQLKKELQDLMDRYDLISLEDKNNALADQISLHAWQL